MTSKKLAFTKFISSSKSKIKKSSSDFTSFLSSKSKTSSSENKIVLLSTFSLLLLGVYFFSVFHEDFEKFNAHQISSSLGITFINATSYSPEDNTESWTALSVYDTNTITPGNAFWEQSMLGYSQGAYNSGIVPINSPSNTNG